MKRTGALSLLILVLLAAVGSALAQDDALVKKFYGVIPAEKLNREPTKYLTVPSGAKLDPRLIGAFYGKSTQEVAFLVRVHDDGRVSLVYGWSAGSSGADNYGGEVAQDGMTIKMDPNVKIWISGDMVKSEWSRVGSGSSTLTKMQPVPIALPAAK